MTALLDAPISRWAYIQAQREVACPKCAAEPPRACVSPKGGHSMIHKSRMELYRQRIGDAEFLKRHKKER